MKRTFARGLLVARVAIQVLIANWLFFPIPNFQFPIPDSRFPIPNPQSPLLELAWLVLDHIRLGGRDDSAICVAVQASYRAKNQIVQWLG